MSAWSVQRKLYIFLTVMVIAGFVMSVVLFTLFYRPPSCDDGIQNGTEHGVDCGGGCPSACPVEPKDLIDVWVRSFPIADGVYSAVAYVENQNRDLYVPEVQFEFELYDENNKRITRASDRTIIMPNGITPVFVPRILTGMRAATSASFRFVKDPEFKKVPRSYGFNVSDVFFEVLEDKPPYVRALARNVSDFIVEKVDFVVILYDEGGAAVTASRTFEENMDPQETRTLQYSWVQPLRLRDDECPEGTCKKKIERVEIVPVVLEW